MLRLMRSVDTWILSFSCGGQLRSGRDPHTCSISCTLRLSSLYFWRYLAASLWMATVDMYALDLGLLDAPPAAAGALPA